MEECEAKMVEIDKDVDTQATEIAELEEQVKNMHTEVTSVEMPHPGIEPGTSSIGVGSRTIGGVEAEWGGDRRADEDVGGGEGEAGEASNGNQ